MTFNLDGKILLCGLHESLKVFFFMGTNKMPLVPWMWVGIGYQILTFLRESS